MEKPKLAGMLVDGKRITLTLEFDQVFDDLNAPNIRQVMIEGLALLFGLSIPKIPVSPVAATIKTSVDVRMPQQDETQPVDEGGS